MRDARRASNATARDHRADDRAGQRDQRTRAHASHRVKPGIVRDDERRAAG